jgi:SM-20-related protein
LLPYLIVSLVVKLYNLQQIFDELVDTYIANKVGEVAHFLNPSLAIALRKRLLYLFAQNKLEQASIGHETSLHHQQNFRSDKIFWLDKNNNNSSEGDFFLLMDAFVLFLNQTCYTSITSYEFHYALYEPGSFYKKHIDAFQQNNKRAFSIVLYLNPDWVIADGGELCIFQTNNLQHIQPQMGNCIFFKSDELPHEVEMVNKDRMSIVGWLRTD